jgi:glucosylglycerate synthase
VEVGDIPQQAQERAAPIETADLVIGLLTDLDRGSIANLCTDLQVLSGSHRIAVLQNDHSSSAAQTNSASAGEPIPFLTPWPLLNPEDSGSPVTNMFSAYQSVFEAGEKLGARACCVVASKLEMSKPGWICQLAQPLLDGSADLVVPRYARRKFEGLLNSSVISPLTRSLYGKRLRNPMGPDLGVSQRVIQKRLDAERNQRTNGSHPVALMVPMTLCDGLQVCELNVGARISLPIDWTNISSLLAQILGPIFLAMEHTAACWQRTRGSASVPAIGDPMVVPQDTGTVDISHLVESFQLGNRDLQEIWSLVLPPATLFELMKLSRLPLAQFRMPDDLWARIIYDFALAHRLRTINRDHLLKSFTPLYLGWVASYAQDMATAAPAVLEQRLERLSAAYEANKSYLVSRWRWPDRFNP